MHTYLDCIPCFFNQALFAARAATEDEKQIKLVLDRIGALVQHIHLNTCPPETGRLIYSTVREVTGVYDPFRKLKDQNIEKALALYSHLKEMVENAADPLGMAVMLAIAGNVIDFGANPRFDIDAEIQEIVKKKLFIDHYDSFREGIEGARHVLYLADNAGETVFDRLLIETMKKADEMSPNSVTVMKACWDI